MTNAILAVMFIAVVVAALWEHIPDAWNSFTLQLKGLGWSDVREAIVISLLGLAAVLGLWALLLVALAAA